MTEIERELLRITLEAMRNLHAKFKAIEAIFDEDGDFALIDVYEPFAEALDVYGIPGQTMYYSRDAINDAYDDFLAEKLTTDAMLDRIIAEIALVTERQRELGDALYEPFDYDKFGRLLAEGAYDFT